MKYFEDRVKGREATFEFVANLCAGCETVLDVGGGAGLLKRFLSPNIKLDVVDLSPVAKSCGEMLFPEVQFVTGTIDDVGGIYDAITCLSTVEHMQSYKPFLTSAWEKVNKFIVLSFFNGLGGTEKIRRFRRQNDYWKNKYSFRRMQEWIFTELNPRHMGVKRIEVNRDYSPEPIVVIWKR